MALDLVALTIDANDPRRLADYWAGVLEWEAGTEAADGILTLVPPGDTGFRLRFPPTDEPNAGPHQMHFDLTSTSTQDQQDVVQRALDLGGRHHDVGQRGDEGHVVLADPEGNEFCVIEPENRFLAGCPRIGALASDGTREVGLFWSAALEWPLVWDEGEETAVQSPHGGPKITWGGPPVRAKTGRNRSHFDLAPRGDSTVAAEVERLLALGATRVDIGQGDADHVELSDPDGNELCIVPPAG